MVNTEMTNHIYGASEPYFVEEVQINWFPFWYLYLLWNIQLYGRYAKAICYPWWWKAEDAQSEKHWLVTLGDRSRVAVVCMSCDAGSSSSSSLFPQSVFSALLDYRTYCTGTPQGVMWGQPQDMTSHCWVDDDDGDFEDRRRVMMIKFLQISLWPRFVEAPPV